MGDGQADTQLGHRADETACEAGGHPGAQTHRKQIARAQLRGGLDGRRDQQRVLRGDDGAQRYRSPRVQSKLNQPQQLSRDGLVTLDHGNRQPRPHRLASLTRRHSPDTNHGFDGGAAVGDAAHRPPADLAIELAGFRQLCEKSDAHAHPVQR